MKRLTEVRKAQMVTGELTFYSVYTPESIIPTVTQDQDEELYFIQAKLWENIINAIRIHANPVIVGSLEPHGFSFAIEQFGSNAVRMFETLIHRLGVMNFNKDGTITKDLTKVRVDEKETFNLASEFYIINSGDGVGLYKTNDDGDPMLRSLAGKDGMDINYGQDDETVEISGKNFLRTDSGIQQIPTYSQKTTQSNDGVFNSDVSNIYTFELTSDNTTITLSEPSDSNARTLTIFLKNGADFTPNFDNNIAWLGGEEPLFGNDDILTFVTVDGGQKWYGSHVGSVDQE